MNRVEVITLNDDDEMWDIAAQVVARKVMDDNQILWVIDTTSSLEAIEQTIPSVVSVKMAGEQSDSPAE